MDRMELRRVLGLHGDLGALTESELDELAGRLRVVELRPGEVLFTEGEPASFLGVVLEGILSQRVHDGGETEVLRAGPGQIVGELGLLDPAPRTTTAVAIRAVRVAVLDRESLDVLYERRPRIGAAVVGAAIKEMTRKLREIDQRTQRLMATARPTSAQGERVVTVEMLRALPGFDKFTDDELGVLVSVAPERHFPAGAMLCRQGEVGRSCFCVVSGEVEVLMAAPAGDQIVWRLRPGSIAGQMALVDRAPRSASLRAAGTVLALELHKETFEKLLAASSPLALRFQRHVAVSGIKQLRGATRTLGGLLEAAAAGAPQQQQPVEWSVKFDSADVSRVGPLPRR